MTDRGLPKLYDRLTLWERLPLLIAAEARHDQVEHDRLFDSSPVKAWRFPEHFLASEALNVIALCHLVDLLEAAATYFFALFQRFGLEPNTERDWALEADLSAFTFQATAGAFRTFSGELGVDPAALVGLNYQGWFANYCAKHMPACAPPEGELRDRLRQAGRDDQDLLSEEALAKVLRELLRDMTRSSPPPTPGGAAR